MITGSKTLFRAYAGLNTGFIRRTTQTRSESFGGTTCSSHDKENCKSSPKVHKIDTKMCRHRPDSHLRNAKGRALRTSVSAGHVVRSITVLTFPGARGIRSKGSNFLPHTHPLCFVTIRASGGALRGLLHCNIRFSVNIRFVFPHASWILGRVAV